VQREQSVSEMAEEVLEHQAKSLAGRTEQSFEEALEAVSGTHAGRQLRELAQGPHRSERADEWQGSLLRERADERLRRDLLAASGALQQGTEEQHHYSWVEGYVEWLEGKEAREQYYALLAEEFLHLKR
jgi:hypothetical protein